MAGNIVINDATPRNQYTATSGQTVFMFNFQAFYPGDLNVYKRPADSKAVDQDDILTLTADYTVTFDNPNALPSTGHITLNVGATTGDIVTIARNQSDERNNYYIDGGPFLASQVNADFDSEVLMIQQARMYDQVLGIHYNVNDEINYPIIDNVLPILQAKQMWRKSDDNTAIEAVAMPSFPVGSLDGDFTENNRVTITAIQTGENLIDQSSLEYVSNTLITAGGEGSWSISSDDELTLTATNDVNLTSGHNLNINSPNNVTIAPTNDVIITPNNDVSINPVGDLTLKFLHWPNTTGNVGQGLVVETGDNIGFADVATVTLPTSTDSIVQFTGTAGELGASPFGVIGNNLILPADPTTPFAAATKHYVDSVVVSGAVDSVVGTPNEIDVDATDPANPIVSLSATLVAPGSVTLNADPTTPLEAATKQYVDALSGGFEFKASVRVATTANLATVYNNGTAGVGATLTNAGTQVALSIDGVTLSVGDRVLVKNQTATLRNGVYSVTDVGSGSTNWVMTRTSDYDTPTEMAKGSLVLIDEGTTNATTSWVQTTTVTTVGTDPVVFSQFTYGTTYPSLTVSGTLTAQTINSPSLTASTAIATDASKNLVSSSTTATELGFVHGVTSGIQTQLNAITNQMVDKLDIDSHQIYGVDIGSTDSYTVTFNPPVASYTPGLVLSFKPNTANTGPCTLNANGLGAVTIKKMHDQDTATGDIEAGQVVTVVYDGTNFQMQSQIAQGGVASGDSISTAVTQTAHGFAVGDVLYLNGSTYTKAIATSAAAAEVVGVVSSVSGANDFILLTAGHINGLSGLTSGTVYFLSATTAGAMAATPPTANGQVLKPLLDADSTTSGFFKNYRGNVISNLSTLQVKIVKFTASGTYTPSANLQYAEFEAVGGGAGGGGAASIGSNYQVGGGGGGGGYSRTIASAATIGASQTVTIGAGGNGGAAGSNAGSNGGDTSVGTLCIGKGATGGPGSSSSPISIFGGGAGGVAGTGDVTIAGQNGWFGGNGASTAVAGLLGSGGNAAGGMGMGTPTLTSVTPTAGNNGQLYGGGGSGGQSFGNGAVAGGNGASGIVIVTEYIA